jgi:hypothetical protein
MVIVRWTECRPCLAGVQAVQEAAGRLNWTVVAVSAMKDQSHRRVTTRQAQGSPRLLTPIAAAFFYRVATPRLSPQ